MTCSYNRLDFVLLDLHVLSFNISVLYFCIDKIGNDKYHPLYCMCFLMLCRFVFTALKAGAKFCHTVTCVLLYG